MTVVCRHTVKNDSDCQDFELISKNTKLETQFLCTGCHDFIIHQQKRDVGSLEHQKQLLQYFDIDSKIQLCKPSVCTQNSKGPDYSSKPEPVKIIASSNDELVDQVQILTDRRRDNLILESKIKSKRFVSDDLAYLSMFRIDGAGELARINGLHCVRTGLKKVFIYIFSKL